MELKPKSRLVDFLLAISAICLLCLAVFSRAETSLNGLASYQYLGKERFIAALYSQNKASQPETLFSEQHRQMEIRCTNSFSARQQIKTWIEGAAINNSANQLENYAEAMVKFTQLIKTPLKPGDHIFIDSPVNSPIIISLNTIVLGQIEAPGFFDVLLRSWIGTVPPSSTFRKDLLAEGIVDQQLKQRFDATHPAEDRILFVQTLIEGPAGAESIDITDGTVDTALVAATPPEASTSQATNSSVEPVAVTASPSAETPAQSTPDPDPVILSPLTTAPTTIDNAQTTPEPDIQETETEAPLTRSESAVSNEPGPSSSPTLDADTLLQQQLFHSSLLKKVNQAVKYPRRALNRSYEGRVTLQVSIDSEGELLSVDTLGASDHKILNNAAKKAVETAAPFPTPPMELEGEDYVFTVPIEFRINE